MTLSGLNPTLAAWLQRPERWLGLLNLCLAMLAGWMLSQIVWQLAPTPTPTTAPVMTQTGPDTGAVVNINEALSLPLFGIAAGPIQNNAAPTDAPDTPLNLTLTGIMAATTPELARALIKDSSNKQRSYGVGDDVPGNARISAIHPDRVILQRSGRYETLRLESNKTPGVGIANTSTNRIMPPSGVSADTIAKLKQVRQQVIANPAKAGDYFRIQPVYNGGQLQGYRLYPGRERELFTQVGLQPGELVTAVNGVTLNDPARGLQLLGDLAQAGSLTLTLEREGQSRTVNISLN